MSERQKPIEELELWDDFMFGAVMREPEYCKPLIEMILNKKVKSISYPELQKTIDNRYDAKGIRLDVFVEDEENVLYDIEIQTTDKKDLPKRKRYYQGMIDLDVINKGEDYKMLKKTYIIFICNYDPFGMNRSLYRFENICTDDTSLHLGDEARTVVLYSRGQFDENASENLKAFMHYLNSRETTDSYTEALAEKVNAVKSSDEWRRAYMKLFMRDRENQEIGKEIGKEIGILASTIQFVIDNPNVTEEDFQRFFKLTFKEVEDIMQGIKAHPNWSAEEIATDMLKED